MNLTFVFFLGFVVTFLTTMPPGLLNMTAAKISMREGHVRSVMFALGACLVIVFQVLLATIFARYLSNHPDVVDILQRVALVIFILVSIYFFFIANKHERPKADLDSRSKTSRFFQGMFLSVINVFPIPFQAYVTISYSDFGWLHFDKISILSYVAGSTSGAFVGLYIYLFFFEKIKSKKFNNQRNMNRIIGTITAIISLITLIRIIQEL